MDEEAVKEASVPVPKPRRNCTANEANRVEKTSYENVSIDLINKNININEENLQNNSKDKLQSNKSFMKQVAETTHSTSNELDSIEANNVLAKLNDLHVNNNDKINPIRLDEVNKLSNIYNDDENVKKPVPAPRRSNAQCSNKVNNNAESISSGGCSPSTGAIRKNSYKNKNSGSYNLVSDEGDISSGDGFAAGKYNLNKSLSSSSLASSQSSNSNAESGGAKYHTTSPG